MIDLLAFETNCDVQQDIWMKHVMEILCQCDKTVKLEKAGGSTLASLLSALC